MSEGIRTAVVQGGLFEVNELGEVWHLTEGTRIRATETKTGKDGKYRIVCGKVDGKLKQFYVSRLVAEAFLPNPDGCSKVYHIDGDPANNRLDNLSWATPQIKAQSAQKSRETVIERYGKCCRICGRQFVTWREDNICPECSRVVRARERASQKLRALQDSMSKIDRALLTDTERLYVELRETGLSLTEVAKLRGVSRQCVDQAIKNALVKSGIRQQGREPSATALERAAAFRAKAAKKRTCAEKLRKEMERLLDKADKLESTADAIAPFLDDQA